MPDKDYMTLLDVLQQEGPGSLKVLDAVRSLGLSSPEVTTFPVTKIDGTSYEINMPAGFPDWVPPAQCRRQERDVTSSQQDRQMLLH